MNKRSLQGNAQYTTGKAHPKAIIWLAKVFSVLACTAVLLFAPKAQSADGPTFHEFVGENNGAPTNSLIGGALDWNRPGYGYYPNTYCIYWSYLEPSRGTWDLTHLTNYGSLLLNWPTGSSNTLVLLDGGIPAWAGNDASQWLPEWTNYVKRVVSYLYAPPFNCRYFQIWNEPFSPATSFWPDGSWSHFFTYVHFPAAQVIHSYAGAKVVFGGYPSAATSSIDDYINQLDTYNAWSSIDVLDTHYYTPYQWSRLRAAADSLGFTDMGIWQSEVGNGGYSASANSFVANEFTRALNWSLGSSWNKRNKYKWLFYSSWAGDNTGLYTGSPATLTGHGQQLQELGALLGYNVLSQFTGITGSLSGLSQTSLGNNSTSVEAVNAGNKVVAFVHLSPTDWTNNSTVSLTFPISASSVALAQRVDLAGTTVSLTPSGTTSTTVSVSTREASGASAQGWNGVTLATGRAATFYVLLMKRESIPGKIEAENFTSEYGIEVDPCTDNGNELCVGYTETGDYMDYSVNVATAGIYSVDFRLATPESNTQLQLVNGGGTVIGTVNVPNTGGWGTWQTVTVKGIPLEAGPQILRVYVSAAAMNINWMNFTLTLPSPWTSKDVGSPGVTGSANDSNGTFTVSGGGADIWNTADAFQFVSLPASGDCSITAKVTAVQNTDQYAKAGVMIRETLTAGSKHATMVLTPSMGALFEYRNTTSGTSASAQTAGAPPYWVRVTRTGNSFAGYISTDGTSWTQVGTAQTISMGTSVYIGLCVTAHNNALLCTSTLSNVTVVP